ncbi:MAG: DUF4352 domain-containing protein [Ktedonobacterales bacterium]|nr:DUF4352 domain-containing protein [Ktedonobacterales bacterium]
MQSAPDPRIATAAQSRAPQVSVPSPPPSTPQSRNVRGLITTLTVGIVATVLIVVVTFVLLSVRAPHGVAATWAITIDSSRVTDGGSIAATALQPGDTYLAIDLTVKNATGNPHDFAGYIDFTAKDGAGQVYKTTYLPGPEPIDGTIPGGATKNGSIAFEVPTNQHAFTLIYADPVFGTQQWAITV